VKLRVEKAVYGGAGLAHIAVDEAGDRGSALAGKTVFVPYALPGELVEAHIVDDRRSFATAQLDRILEPVTERVSPRCEYFPVCGGCQYQHANNPYQLQIKLDILRDTLVRAHLPWPSSGSSTAIGATASTSWGYRNRIRLHIARESGSGGDRLTLCYRERGSHANLPVTHCAIAAPVLEEAISAVLRMEKANRLARLCDEIEFFTNAEGNQLLVSLWSSRPESLQHGLEELLGNFAGQLQSQIPILTGVGVFSLDPRGSRLLDHWGPRSLLYTVSGRAYQVSLGSFFQVNRFLLPDLLRLVVDDASGAGRSGQLAWDLYAGVGLFTLALDFAQVIAVEAAPSSAADLKQNLRGTPHRVVQSTALDFLRAQSRRKPRIDPGLILLDPPRDGLGKEVCERLADIAAPEVVYVSCDPATLARDLQTLLHSGYCLESLRLIDLFPQTFHLESIAVLKSCAVLAARAHAASPQKPSKEKQEGEVL
jgi:23S rRNA (uracil1939-C5)-methyltransferase